MVDITSATRIVIRVTGQGVPGTPGTGAPDAHAPTHSRTGLGGTDSITVENLATAGGVGSVPTSDGAGGLSMSVPAGSGNVVSPGAETAGNLAEFTGPNAIDETAITTASVSGHLASTSNPHSVTAAQAGADPTGTATAAVAAHDALTTAHSVLPVENLTTAGTSGQVPVSDGAGNLTMQAQAGGVTDHGALTGLVPDDDHTQYQLRTEKDAASGYAGLDGSTKLAGAQQTYGTLANTAAQGNDARLSDSRAPNGPAGGDLDGTYPNPTVDGLQGTPVSSNVPTVGQTLQIVAGTWTPVTPTGATDPNAYHDNVAGEIAATALKATPISGDFIVIEDSVDSNNKKRITVGTLPTGGGGEANTLTSVGVGGVSILATPSKVGIDLQTATVNSLSSAITIAADVPNDKVDWDLVPANISHAAIGDIGTNSHAAIDAHIADMVNPHGITGNEDLITGLVSGGEMSVNGGDPALFDVAAGVGVVIDWSTPGSPVRTIVNFGPFVGEAVPSLPGIFTFVFVNAAGSLVKQSTTFPTAVQRKTLIRLETVQHDDGVSITGFQTDIGLAYQATAALIDYAIKIGIINEGNRIFAASTDLTVAKSAGTSSIPFINAAIDTQDAATKINIEVNPSPNVAVTYRDGVGGFVFDPTPLVVDPDLFDDGSGTLAAVPPNRHTIRQFHVNGASNQFTMVYGQATYSSQAAALAALFTENPIVSPNLEQGSTVLTSFLVVQEGTTDLSVIADAVFVDNVGFTSGSGSGGAAGTWIGLLDTADLDYVGKAGQVSMVDVIESGLELTQLDHTLHLSNIGTNSHAAIDTHIGDVTGNPHAVTAAQAGAEPAGAVATHNADGSAHTALLDLAGTRLMTGDFQINGNEIDGGILLGGTLTDVGLFQYLDEVGSVGFYGDPQSPALLVAQATDFDVATGVGSFHTGATAESPLGIGDWPAALAQAIPIDTVRYVGVEWNAGTPQVVVKTTNVWTLIQEWPIGVVTRDSDGVHIAIFPPRLTNFSSLIDQRISETEPFVRANGLNLGTNLLTVQRTAGRGWLITTPQDFALFDTGVADTFDRYFADGVGGFNVQLTQTSFEDQSFDDGSGVLATLTNNRFGVRWFYMDLQTGGLSMMYGVSDSREIAEALLEEPPTLLPPRLQVGNILLGRVVVLKSAGASTVVDDIWGTTFSSGGGGDGDVTGPVGGVVQDELTVFTDTSGKSIGGSGILSTAVELSANKGAVSGYASLNASTRVVEAVQVIHETGSPQDLTVGVIADLQVLTRSGTTIVGVAPAGIDSTAIHDNVGGEINAVADKASPVGADVLLIEDSAASFGKKRVSITNLPGGADADAIHDNVAGEIVLVTEKVTPIGADLILIEDSSDSNNKKRVQITNLPGGGGGGFPTWTFAAPDLDPALTADWAVNSLAPLSADPTNDGLTTRVFDDASDDGVGWTRLVPSGAANMTITIKSRAETAPGGAETVVPNLYVRALADNVAVAAWSSAVVMTTINIPTTAFYQEDSQTETLATWGVTAGNYFQFEFVNDNSASTITSPWHVLYIEVTFT